VAFKVIVIIKPNGLPVRLDYLAAGCHLLGFGPYMLEPSFGGRMGIKTAGAGGISCLCHLFQGTDQSPWVVTCLGGQFYAIVIGFNLIFTSCSLLKPDSARA